MLWSLLKVLLFVFAVAGLTWGASLLLDTGGGIRIAAAGYEFTLGPLQAVITLLVLMLVIWIVMKIIGLLVATLRFLNGDETAISRYFDRNRERKGYAALNEGLIALASGEGRLALLRAQRAEKYLGKPELTTLLVAQAAEAAEDTARAATAYKSLLADESTRFVGIRGLLQQKLAEGDTDTALEKLQHAVATDPANDDTRFDYVKLLLQLGRSFKAGAPHRVMRQCAAAGVGRQITGEPGVKNLLTVRHRGPPIAPGVYPGRCKILISLYCLKSLVGRQFRQR